MENEYLLMRMKMKAGSVNIIASGFRGEILSTKNKEVPYERM